MSTKSNKWVMGAVLQGAGIECGLFSELFYTSLGFSYSQSDRLSRTTANFVVSPSNTNNLNIFLFSRNWNGSSVDSANCRIYSAEIYDNGQPIRSFVPCYNKNLNELGEEFGFGLYDTVEGVFYGNSGTGKFYGRSFLEEGETCKVYDYEQYFIDLEMTNDISTTTITGTGTENDPYILNSSEDFWWATKYINWNQKRFILASDIVLNEEKFDENGNASGGNGIVYSWTLRGAGYSNTNFDGNNHTVFGLYHNDESVSGVSLFREVASLKNISVDNLFLKGNDQVAAFKHTYDRTYAEIENCHVLKGTIIGNSTLAGLCIAAKSITNCSNSATINGTGNLSGIVCSATSCYLVKNYGNVTGTSHYAAGICASNSNMLRIVFCENYGTITAERYACGINCGCYGYVGSVREILRCKNYGTIRGDYSALIMGYCSAKAIIDGCENYGKIDASKSVCGAIVTQVFSAPNGNDGDLTVTNCYVKGNGNIPFIYNLGNKAKAKFENNVYEVEDFTDNKGLLVQTVSADVDGCSLMIKNFKFKVKAVGRVNNLLINYYTNNSRISMENVCFDIDKEVTSLFSKKITFEKLDGIIVKTPTQKWFYGSNFSGFNISWRTGAISLNSMSSIGSFAPKLTEENLIDMGFEKKTI